MEIKKPSQTRIFIHYSFAVVGLTIYDGPAGAGGQPDRIVLQKLKTFV